MDTGVVLRAVLSEAEITTSSDLIVTLYEFYKRVGETQSWLLIDPVFQWEYKNWHDGCEKNVAFIEKRLPNLDIQDYTEVHAAYTFVLSEFLANPVFSVFYKLDNKDTVGNQIEKELRGKRDATEKHLMIETYKNEKS